MLKTGRMAGFRQGHAVPDFVPGPEETLGVDIFADTVAGLLLKKLHQIATADKELSGKSLDRQIAVQMFIDIVKNFRDLLIGRSGFDITEAIRQKASVELHQKLDEKTAAVQFCGVFFPGEGKFQLFAEPEKRVGGGGGSAEHRQSFLLFRLFLKTGLQRVVRAGVGAQKVGGDVEDDPLIGGGGADDGSVYIAGSDQHNVAGFQAVSYALYKIVHIPREKKKYFVKVMVMAVIVFYFMIGEMKQFKRGVQIAGFFIIHSDHRVPSGAWTAEYTDTKTPGAGPACGGSFAVFVLCIKQELHRLLRQP